MTASSWDGERKFSLEEYMDFCDHPHRPDLVIDQLNHIIFMHGFIRLHRRNKAVIMATLNAMELMPASRSTLHESISRCAPLAVEEVSRDLGAVGWRECPVASVRRVGPPGAEAVEDAVPISAAAPPTAVKKVRKKRKRGGSLPLLAMAPPSCEASSC